MTRRRPFGAFSSKERYIEEIIEQQERELEEIRRRKAAGEILIPEEEKPQNPYDYVDPLTKQETRGIVKSALLAALLIGGIMIFAMFLFLLFCTKIWFV